MKLNYKIYGEGEPLIVIHGLLGMLDNWSTHARRWGKKYRVITVDARNHGRSSHSEEMNYEAMVEDLNKLMDDLGINESVSIVDGFANQPFQKELSGSFKIGGNTIPMVMLVGNKTGRVYYFALKALLPDINL